MSRMNVNGTGKFRGHLVAAATTTIWGVTFIASKVLLEAYSPIQLLFLRSVLGYAVLLALCPRLERPKWPEEGLFFLLGVLGCSLYFFLEYCALSRTYAANVSILVGTAPLFTVLLARLFLRGQRTGKRLYAGLAVATAGVVLVVLNGSLKLRLSPAGDVLSLGAAVCWALYSILQDKVLEKRDGLYIARKVAFYGLLTALPLLLGEKGAAPLSLRPLWETPLRLGCLLYLGLLGSGVTYFSWAWTQKALGVIVTNNYLFAMPFVSLVAAVLLLGEPLTAMGALGSALVILGVFLADRE